MTDQIKEAILHAAGQWWVLPLTFVLCVVDGFFPVVPSESVIVALASISGGGEGVALWLLWIVGVAGAIVGDQIAYSMGRRIGTDRFRWMRTRTVQRAVSSARNALESHGAFVITTARFIPGGRVAVNYTAGATRFPRKWFTLLDVIAAMIWSGYSIGIGRATAGWLDNPILQILVAVVAAGVIGWIIDAVLKRIYARVLRRAQAASPAPPLVVDGDDVDSPRD